VRLWSLHPRYLDAPGLVALWREGLLARAVLRGETRGYRHHPQLERFRAHPTPRRAVDAYLHSVCDEAMARGYSFDRAKLGPRRAVKPLKVTRGQVSHEWQHLLRKLRRRAPARFRAARLVKSPACHPLLRRRAGALEPWERA
jgi:hypothetical protein